MDSGTAPKIVAGSLVHRQQPMAETLSGLVGPSLPPSIIEQLQRIQQQMYDQFQQTLRGMARMLMTAHEQQVVKANNELEQIRRVTSQLQSLQEELKALQLPDRR